MMRSVSIGGLASLFLVGAACSSQQSPFVDKPAPGVGGAPATGGVAGVAGGAAGGTMSGAGGAGGAGGTPDLSHCGLSIPPAEPQPMPPQSAVSVSCLLAADAATEWSFPTFAGDAPDADERALIVGRWAACGASGFGIAAHDAIEFGGNGRWRALVYDSGRALVPVDASVPRSRGYYYMLASGQLDIAGEGPTDGTFIFHVELTPGMEALRIDADVGQVAATYGRTAPSPLNGDDNPPSTADGQCSMVGTWLVPGTSTGETESPIGLTFDGQGNFTGGPFFDNGCPSRGMYGTYRLSPGMFQLTSNVGFGACHWWFSAGYPSKFDGDCSHLTTMQLYDNCTGGRGYLNGTVTMTRIR